MGEIIQNPDMAQAVSRALQLCNRSCRNPREIDGELLRLWVAVLTVHHVEPQDVHPATERLLGEEPFFPAPADLVRCAQPFIQARRHRKHITRAQPLPAPDAMEREREACRQVREEILASGRPFARAIAEVLEAVGLRKREAK